VTGICDGRTAIVTGAGRGIGRAHALELARQGANVVVNDVGFDRDGSGSATSAPAQAVVEEIEAAGGRAVADANDVADWDGAAQLVETALEAFGQLDVLVNNAGILRDRMLVNMSIEEWDAVIRVHLKGHAAPLRWAAVYWRAQSKEGRPVAASVVNTSSTSGLLSNPGQTNYGAAKSGIATLTEIAAKELTRYGVRVNAICPAARTRLTMASPGTGELMQAADDEFDAMDPANISPFVAYLATADCPITGKVFFVYGGAVHLFQPWTMVDAIQRDSRWTVADLRDAAAKWGAVTFDQSIPI
jgi:NAD(P)-dependent dehydrogenase (short-subunit alcohol dehydrogenase family)